MNRSKKLYILLGVLAAACIATTAVLGIEERKEQIRSSGEIILELPGESIQALSWEYGGETLAFHKDGTWRYDEDENFPVSTDKINGLLEQFQAFGAAFVIEDVEDFGQYGLDDPVCTIRLSAAEQTCEIRLGDYSKMDAQRYVSIGDGNVYLAVHDPLDEFDAALSDMILHDELPALEHVTGIEFSGAENGSITREENSACTYSSEDIYFTRRDGRNLPLDTAKVEAYLRNIANLHPSDYVSYHVTEEELQAYGLDEPALTITVNYTAEGADGEDVPDTLVLHVSPDPEAEKEAGEGEDGAQDGAVPAYIRIGTSQIIYRISADSWQKLSAASYDSLRHPEVIWAELADVRQIDVSLEGTVYSLTAEKDGSEQVWLFQGEEFEITGLWDSLTALTAEEFTGEEPEQKEEIRLTVYLDNENVPEVQIALYRYDGTRCLAAADGESVSLVERAAVVDLIEAVHAIVLH